MLHTFAESILVLAVPYLLYNFISANSKVGLVSPLLVDSSNTAYPNQGSDEFTFISAIAVFSFIGKYLLNNKISRKFFHLDWDKKNVEEFDVVPGAAFMIKKSVFEEAGKFDEDFFLYFEEYDLARRIKK